MKVFEGLKVLDVASFIAAPMAAAVLSDFGAEVVKIEPPGEGDGYRQVYRLPNLPVCEHNYAWALVARNKRALALDLKHPEGRAVLHRLVAACDVLITNYPPGVRRRLGLDYAKSAMRHLAAVLCASLLAVCSAPASAQEGAAWPDRPIKLVLPTAPGGALDAFTRQMAERLSASLKQPVIVDNRPGANGMIASIAVAHAPADGYTVLVSLSSLVQTPLLNLKAGYRLEELAPVSLTAYLPNGFAVGGAVPAKTLAEFIEYANANKGKLSYGSSGSGSSGHIMGETLKRSAKIDMVHAAFKGESPAILAVIGGDITAAFGAPGTQAEYAKAGKVRLLAVAAPRRLRDFPDVATFTELGFPDVDLPGWSGVLMPAGTPKAIVDRFAAEWVRVVKQPEIANRIFGFGFEPVGSTPEVFRQFIKTENDKWSAAIKGSSITLE